MILSNALKKTAIRYGLTVFLILALFLCALFFNISKNREADFTYNILLLVLMICIIFYNLWRIYKNESELIISSDKAGQLALAKSRFLASVSHEIRTPLNSVMGFSEQLGESKLNPQQTEQLKAIQSSSAMALALVNDILDLAKYETRKVKLDKKSFTPFQCINEVVDMFSVQATNKGIELKTDISFSDTVCVLGDQLRFKQLLINLLGNAIKFTERGSVKVKATFVFTAQKNILLNVTVIDTGIGIREVDLAMIFDEFAQVDYMPTQIKQQGTGLGLAICKNIVELQDGKITVESELGRGSIFGFSIPYEIGDEIILEIQDCKQLDLKNLIGKRILWVDDNLLNTLLAKTVIAKYKIITDVAHDGHAAFKLFRQNQYDLVLTDIQMPIMTGVDLAKAIRLHEDALKRNIPILGVTADLLAEDCEVYSNAGMNGLVLKPFSEKGLMEKIIAQLSQ